MPKRTWNETRNKVPSRDASYSFHPMADCTVVEVAALTLYTAPSPGTGKSFLALVSIAAVTGRIRACIPGIKQRKTPVK